MWIAFADIIASLVCGRWNEPSISCLRRRRLINLLLDWAHNAFALYFRVLIVAWFCQANVAHGLERLYADLGLVGALQAQKGNRSIICASGSISLHRISEKLDVELKESSVAAEVICN